jgi:hypothetical protein
LYNKKISSRNIEVSGAYFYAQEQGWEMVGETRRIHPVIDDFDPY